MSSSGSLGFNAKVWGVKTFRALGVFVTFYVWASRSRKAKGLELQKLWVYSV